MSQWPNEEKEEDWYPFDQEESPQEKKSIFEGIDPVLGAFGALSWGCMSCVFASVCGFFFAAGTAGIMESTQDRRAIDLESVEALWLIVGWSAVFFLSFMAISAVGFYLLRRR